MSVFLSKVYGIPSRARFRRSYKDPGGEKKHKTRKTNLSSYSLLHFLQKKERKDENTEHLLPVNLDIFQEPLLI